MKKYLFQFLMLVASFFFLTSATSVSHFGSENFDEIREACGGTVSNLVATRNGQNVVFTWNTSGADGYTYGGFYNVCPPPPGTPYIEDFTTTTVWTTTSSHQVTLYSPVQPGSCPGHFGVGAKCSNGEQGGYQSVWYY